MDDIRKPVPKFDRDAVNWPLSYIQIPPKTGDPPRKYWHYSYYRGPWDRPPQVLYSDDLSRSEDIARIFLGEPVLGFDMEWRIDAHNSTRLQDKVALIQIACERRIALFHIARHDGKTVQDLIAPSLCSIIESASIIKTGVSILHADFNKLKKDLGLQPRGALELSHLHHLVSQNPKRVTTRLCALSKQVEYHFGLPLEKGDVRTSNWSLPLNENQRMYAANDAYAGFMLFHCMNAKRLAITPVPPLPKLAKSYLPFDMPRKVGFVQFEKWTETRPTTITAKPLVASHVDESNAAHDDHNIENRNIGEEAEMRPSLHTEDGCVEYRPKEVGSSSIKKSYEPVTSTRLYQKLVAHRKRIAVARDVSAFIVASNKVLQALASRRPSNKSQLLEVHGVGRYKADLYGDDWLEIIAQDRVPLQPTNPNRGTKAQRKPEGQLAVEENAIPEGKHGVKFSQPSALGMLGDAQHSHPADREPKRWRVTNIRRSKELHIDPSPKNTGLSFYLADTRLDTDEAPAKMADAFDHDALEDNSYAFGTPLPSPTPSQLKRKRAEVKLSNTL
ncbi:ribonuclease H-like domain-containing protein [Hypoxylon cercidicola]|nr:ribonuclease H-like domain-containing protein [Hypoxylon cercidicola]